MNPVELVSNVGFPIGITIYLLWNRDQVISKNTEAIRELIIMMRRK